MQRPQPPASKYPVFVFPSSVTFFRDDPASFRQVVTLYNPYDISITYKVFSNRPDSYRVVEPVGVLQSKCCVDVVIRHKNPADAGDAAGDKFRVDIGQVGRKQVLGRAYVPVSIMSSRPVSSDVSTASVADNIRHRSDDSQSSPTPSQSRRHHASGQFAVLAVAAACVLALLLPTWPDTAAEQQSSVDSWQSACWWIPQLSVHTKLAAAYTLGLLTMLLLRAA